MITIHSAMLVMLGFFVAALVCFLVAPAYRRRAARLATDEIKASMPLTAAEIRADKDRLRAEFAISIHKLEAKLDEANFAAARQMVEINRRDAAVSALEGEVARTRTFLDEHENARRVLEQTITERLPKVEIRLAEAKKLLGQRDRELGDLSQSANKHSHALEEATQINAQQRDEIHRLNATLTMHAARNRESLMDPRFDAEVALRAEIEALRAKSRDQSAVINRLQVVLTKSDAEPGQATGMQSRNGSGDGELVRLQNDLAEAEQALRSVKGAAEAGHSSHSHVDAELRALRSASQDHLAEIAKLKAALQSYESGNADDRTIKDSKIALKARMSALQAQADEQATTIQTLRSEVAAGNEKLARQAAHYMDEMRRLGAGTMPAIGPQRRSLYESPRRASLSERISAPRSAKAEPAGETGAHSPPGMAEVPAAMAQSEQSPSAGGFLKALVGKAETEYSQQAAAGEAAHSATNGTSSTADGEPADEAASKPVRRPGLLERITGLEKQA